MGRPVVFGMQLRSLGMAASRLHAGIMRDGGSNKIAFKRIVKQCPRLVITKVRFATGVAVDRQRLELQPLRVVSLRPGVGKLVPGGCPCAHHAETNPVHSLGARPSMPTTTDWPTLLGPNSLAANLTQSKWGSSESNTCVFTLPFAGKPSAPHRDTAVVASESLPRHWHYCCNARTLSVNCEGNEWSTELMHRIHGLARTRSLTRMWARSGIQDHSHNSKVVVEDRGDACQEVDCASVSVFVPRCVHAGARVRLSTCARVRARACARVFVLHVRSKRHTCSRTKRGVAEGLAVVVAVLRRLPSVAKSSQVCP